MRAKVLLVVGLLVIWALGGSVALALDHCSAMGASCEAPCGLVGATLVENTGLSAVIIPPATLATPSGPTLQTRAVRGLDPVPKPLRLSA
jgi:hypothetical protein